MAKQERIDVGGRDIGSVCRVPWKGLPAWCIAGNYSGGRFETREAAVAELQLRYQRRHLLATDRTEAPAWAVTEADELKAEIAARKAAAAYRAGSSLG